MYMVAKNLSNVKTNIQVWNTKSFGHIFKKKEDIKRKLDLIQKEIQQKRMDVSFLKQENELFLKLHSIIFKEKEF